MEFVSINVQDQIAEVTLRRGKVNPINEQFCDELLLCFDQIRKDDGIRAVILTGSGKFFSFGLDIPEFVNYSKADFTRFVAKFADLYTILFSFPKPVIGAFNGHTIAGGCMIALACDYRIMASGQGMISLNEINFGSSLFPGSVEMLKHTVGLRNAEIVAVTGAMFTPEEALKLGLIDAVTSEKDLLTAARRTAMDLAAKHAPAYSSIKKLLRMETAESVRSKDARFSKEIIDIWYSEHTWAQLHNIKIHM